MARVTLTFDNGPTPGTTEGVLDVLGERGLRATFFVVGSDLLRDGRRELAERAAREGHWHGNHTMTHSIQFGNSDDPTLPEREIGEAQRILADLSHPDKFFRPWGDGHISPRILSAGAIDYLRAGGYTCVLWNCVPRDWEDPEGWPDKALTTIAEQDWTVLVVHDQPTGAMHGLARFLDRAADLGVEFTQEFPDSCVPIRHGLPTGPLEHLHQSQ
jgi:peptidoglycan-N-acetylglucosamine deacetylase